MNFKFFFNYLNIYLKLRSKSSSAVLCTRLNRTAKPCVLYLFKDLSLYFKHILLHRQKYLKLTDEKIISLQKFKRMCYMYTLEYIGYEYHIFLAEHTHVNGTTEKETNFLRLQQLLFLPSSSCLLCIMTNFIKMC